MHHLTVEEHVSRFSLTGALLAATVACALGARPVRAQLAVVPQARFELTAFGGYQWGGAFETFANGAVPPGELQISDAFGWGAILGFVADPQTVVELTYLRQDADISFNPNVGTERALGGFAVNYVQLGGRYDFIHPGHFTPFINLSLGIGIFDPKTEGIGSDTRFSWSVGTGAKYMFGEAQRLGLRLDGRLWVTPVPSGDYGVWCDFYGCFAAEGTAWVTQGTVSGGLTVAF
jgi:hypothetical protein